VERIAPLDPINRRCLHRLIDQVGRRVGGIHDVAVIGDADHRWRQVDIEPDRGTLVAVVDEDELAASRVAPDPAQQPAIGRNNGDDFRAVGTDHDGAGLAALLQHPDVTRPVAKALHLVVTDELQAGGIADDDASGLHDDGAAALLDLAPFGAEILEPTRTRRRRALRDGRQGLWGRRRRRRERRGHLRRGAAGERGGRAGRRTGRWRYGLSALTAGRWRCALLAAGRWCTRGGRAASGRCRWGWRRRGRWRSWRRLLGSRRW